MSAPKFLMDLARAGQLAEVLASTTPEAVYVPDDDLAAPQRPDPEPTTRTLWWVVGVSLRDYGQAKRDPFEDLDDARRELLRREANGDVGLELMHQRVDEWPLTTVPRGEWES